MNAPDPLHSTKNSCFGAFRTVSLLYESWCKTGRTSAINAQVRWTKLRWNFSQRMHPIYSIRAKMHVLAHFGPFRYFSKDDEKLAELAPLMHKFAKRSCVRHFSQRAHPIHSIGPKTHVLGRVGPFRYCTKLDAKLAELAPLMHKFLKRSCVGTFCNECTRSTPLDPKLMFGHVSDHFITLRKSMQNWPN
jgi:hypothetical protein